MNKLLSHTGMECILDLMVMACRVLKWDLTEGSIGRSGTLVLMVRIKPGKNGNIQIVVLLPGAILMEVILKYLLQVSAILMNLYLTNMLISSAKTMMVT